MFGLARRILSITANSASCKRLFSTFGTILTKHRNRLLLQNMLNQAELKSHIRNEHLGNSHKKSKLQDRFNSQKETSKISIIHSSNLILSSSVCQPVNDPRPVYSGSSQEGSDTVATDSSDSANTGFRNLITQYVTQVDIDDENDEPLFPTGPLPRGTMLRLPLIPIQDLFNFQNTYWQSLVKATITRTFDKELEFYDMLDLDADGEDIEVDVDNATGDILLG